MTNNRGSKSAAAISVLAAAVIFAVFSLFRTVESVSLASSQSTVNKIGYGLEVDEGELRDVIAARESGIWFGDRARIHSDAALARILLAERTQDADERETLLDAAGQDLETSLRLNPGNPYAWFRLAYARNLQAGPDRRVAEALRLSLLTGPHEPRLVFTRLPLALAAMEHFDAPTLSLLQRQIRFAWRRAPRQTAFLSVSFGRQDFFRQAIALTDPEGVTLFLEYTGFLDELRPQR